MLVKKLLFTHLSFMLNLTVLDWNKLICLTRCVLKGTFLVNGTIQLIFIVAL